MNKPKEPKKINPDQPRLTNPKNKPIICLFNSELTSRALLLL